MSQLERGEPRAPVVDQPAWDLSPEYASFEDPLFLADLGRVRELLGLLEALEPELAPALERADALDPGAEASLLELCRRALLLREEAGLLFANLHAYARCRASLDGRELRAKECLGILASLEGGLDRALSALGILTARASEPFIEALLRSEEGRPQAFKIGQARKYRSRLLPLAEEKLIASLAPEGHAAWGELYNSIAGSASCRIRTPSGEERSIGLAEAASLWREADRGLREAGYRAQAEAFGLHEESLAAILNSIAGWRLAEARLRSGAGELHFLDPALAQNRLSRASLEAMLGAVAASRELGRRALRLQARLLGLERLACWDILAPAPALPGEPPRLIGFAEGLALVREAYAEIEPAMGDFVDRMAREGRIEARVLPNKRPGAYCTRFAKSRNTRVFQTYRGSLSDVFTLAHELGHAYHGELLRDLHPAETDYPMTLAETASTFAETALGEHLARRGEGEAGLLDLAWSDAQDAATFLVNIPARYAFETAFYEKRKEKPLGPAALGELMRSAWEEHYGDSLSEQDPHFWKSKLHFYFTGTSFYNFPYTFGYLFSLGVYARREALGADFPRAYRELLRDTGRMEVEELARKHLGVELSEPGFWEGSLTIVRLKVERFGELVEKLAPLGAGAAGGSGAGRAGFAPSTERRRR